MKKHLQALQKYGVRRSTKYLVGIDEVGRGALAGPVTVGIVLVPSDFDFALLADIRDSKQLSPQQRQDWLARAKGWRRDGRLKFTVASVSNTVIDKKGLSYALRSAIRRGLGNLIIEPADTVVMLDGGLHAPKDFTNQESIVKGDEKVPVISLASIIAKEHRDAMMRTHAELYPGYGFENNVGYGTAEHRRAISCQGLTPLHRQSFCH